MDKKSITESIANTSVAEKAAQLVYKYIYNRYSDNEVQILLSEIKAITRIDNQHFTHDTKAVKIVDYAEIQELLSKLNEKESIRKSKGVYYTPNDVVRFILTNSVKALYGKLTANNISDMELLDVPYRSFCCKKDRGPSPVLPSGKTTKQTLKECFLCDKLNVESIFSCCTESVRLFFCISIESMHF